VRQQLEWQARKAASLENASRHSAPAPTYLLLRACHCLLRCSPSAPSPPPRTPAGGAPGMF